MRACIVCGDTNHRVAFQEFDVAVLRCRGCGHVFSSHASAQHYDGYFGDAPVDVADTYWWNEAHERMYDAFCTRFLVGRRGRLLDVGCGLGFFVRRVSAVPGWSATGYEVSTTAVQFARGTLGLDAVHAGTIEDAPLPAESFDIVTLWDVVEHIPDPDPLLSRVARLLTHGGMVFLHTPNVAVQLPKARLKKLAVGMRPGVHYLEAKDHLNIYSMRTLARVLTRNGFTDVRFIHLPPIQSVAGARNGALTFVKNVWSTSSAMLHRASFGRINMDNLFAVASRGAAS